MGIAEEKKKRESRGFLIKQKAFIKYSILRMLEENEAYGLRIQEQIIKLYEDLGFSPTHSVIYECLFELTNENILIRTNITPPENTFKEYVFYSITSKGKEKAARYKALVEYDLNRSLKIIQRGLSATAYKTHTDSENPNSDL